MDCINLRGFVNNITRNLDNPGEMDKFISGLTYGDQYFWLIAQDRLSIDPI